jgi:outer membrane protein OmpA-like peptidoglycan-associated protein
VDEDNELRALQARAGEQREHWGFPPGLRYRSVSNHLVIFDTDVALPSNGAKVALTHYLHSNTFTRAALSIRGGTDRQGTRPWNARLSRSRAINVARYVLDDLRYPPIVDLNWVGEDGPTEPTNVNTSEPYNRIVRIQMLEPCP